MRRKVLTLLIAASIVFSVFTNVAADTNADISAFVTRLYEICLDRAPDQGGLDTWVANLSNGSVSGSDAARGFLFSSEFTGRNYDNRTFVMYLYRAMFGREADEAGLNSWTESLDSGMSRNQVFNGFTGSDEWADICSSYGIDPGSSSSAAHVNSGIEEFVSRLYSGFLGRSADPTGLADWSAKISSGNTTGFEAAYGFMHSNEFLSRAASMSNTAVVNVFYNRNAR